MIELSVWTPAGHILSRTAKKVTATGVHGSFSILPRHVDAVAALRPGLLIYETENGEGYLAINEGCLTKRECSVTVVTMQAFQGDSLEDLAGEVEGMLHSIDEGERKTRSALAGLESRIARGLAGMEVKLGRE